MFNLFKPFDIFKISYGGNTYNPLINYDWSTNTTSGLRYLKDVGSTPTYNASMYFGRGAYFNGVDQYYTLGSPSNYNLTNTFTISFTAVGIGSVIGIESLFKIEMVLATRILILKQGYWGTGFAVTTDTTIMSNYLYTYDGYTETLRKNGVIIYSTVGHVFTFNMSTIAFGLGKVGIGSNSYFKGTFKDVYLFNRVLTQSEITQAYEQPELFYAMAQADGNCVLNMPMCETSSTARNYKAGIDYPITNYTSSVRDNAKNLQYGLQTCKFVRDSLGVIQSSSEYLECNGTGYATIPSHADTVNIKMTVNPTSLGGNLLSGGVTKTLTGLTLNVDNDVVISNVTPTGAITLASGFSGTIKTYTEELV